MSDRIKGLVVTLDRDVREDDLHELVTAIKCFRLVADVSPSVTDIEDLMKRQRIRNELGARLWEVSYLKDEAE